MKIFKHLFFASTVLLFVSCSSINSGSFVSGGSESNEQNSNSSIEEKDYFEENKNDTYIVGKRVFDLDYINDQAIKESFTVEQIPDANFEYINNKNSFVLSVGGETSININYSLYIADVNQDSHYDICYSHTEGSGVLSFKVGIYDFYNKKSLFLSSDSYTDDCLFDLDDNNLLVLEQFDQVSGTKFLLNQSRRILKNSNNLVEFESFDLDSKIKGINCSFSPAGDNVKKGETLRINLFIKFLAKNVVSCPLQINDITVFSEDLSFSYSINKQEGTASYLPDFTIDLSFGEEGEKEVNISVEQFFSSGIIRVYS